MAGPACDVQAFVETGAVERLGRHDARGFSAAGTISDDDGADGGFTRIVHQRTRANDAEAAGCEIGVVLVDQAVADKASRLVHAMYDVKHARQFNRIGAGAMPGVFQLAFMLFLPRHLLRLSRIIGPGIGLPKSKESNFDITVICSERSRMKGSCKSILNI